MPVCTKLLYLVFILVFQFQSLQNPSYLNLQKFLWKHSQMYKSVVNLQKWEARGADSSPDNDESDRVDTEQRILQKYGFTTVYLCFDWRSGESTAKEVFLLELTSMYGSMAQ